MSKRKQPSTARSRSRRVTKVSFKLISIVRGHAKKLLAVVAVILAVLFAIVVDLIQSHYMTQGGLNALELALDIMGAK